MNFLIDTGAFYALADDSDRNATAAREFYRKHLETDEFVTTDAVVLESWTLIRNKLQWPAARRFLESLKRAGIPLLYIEPADIEVAGKILDAYVDQELSLVDAASFSLMERHGIVHAFTFDKDFLLYRYGPRNQRSFTCWP